MKALKKVSQNKKYPKKMATDVEITEPKKKVFSREEFLLGFIFSHPEIYEVVTSNLIDNIAVDPETNRVGSLCGGAKQCQGIGGN